MARVEKSRIVEAHKPHGTTVWVWVFCFLGTLIVLEALLAFTIAQAPWWACLPLVLIIAHIMHAHTLAFHEAAHGTLSPNRFWNEVVGLFIGSLSLQCLTAFRRVHHTHHVHLSSEKDEELWPFVDPSKPRWLRSLAALFELTLGITYTPMLCLRTFFRSGSPIKNPAERRRVWYEFGLMAVVWSAILAAVAWAHLWSFLLVMFVLPGVLAGDMHSFRKYTEHMGLTGSTILSSTRSVRATNRMGRLFAFTLFNIPFHGVHHRYAKIPQAQLPEFSPLLIPTTAGELEPYPNYRTAMWEMLQSLSDPRVGTQWLKQPAEVPASSREMMAQPSGSYGVRTHSPAG